VDKYSVLMSVYYGENANYFEKSIMSMLNQSIKPSDFVVVCDGPLNEGLNKVIANMSNAHKELFQIIRLSKNQGLGIALQEGLKRCKYNLVARMDSDDIAMPDRMEKQLDFLKNNKNVCAVGGQIIEFYDEIDNIVGRREVPLGYKNICEMLKFRNPMNHVTVVFKKKDILEVGGYQSLVGFEDYYLWARMIIAGKVVENISTTCCLVRVGNNMYGRRGGSEYFKNTVFLEKFLLLNNVITTFQFLRNVIIRFGGAIVLPSYIRAYIYKKFLRKTESEK